MRTSTVIIVIVIIFLLTRKPAQSASASTSAPKPDGPKTWQDTFQDTAETVEKVADTIGQGFDVLDTIFGQFTDKKSNRPSDTPPPESTTGETTLQLPPDVSAYF